MAETHEAGARLLGVVGKLDGSRGIIQTLIPGIKPDPGLCTVHPA